MLESQIEPPTGIFIATLLGRARNSGALLVLYFSHDCSRFSLSVRARHDFAPCYGGPAFDAAPLGQRYVLAVRRIRSGAVCLEYAMQLASEDRQSNP